MKKTIFILFNLVFYISIIQSQTCLPDGFTFAYQSQIDDFSANNPGCTEIIGKVTIQEEYTDNITNLNGLLNVEIMGNDFVIGNNNSLDDLGGLDNITTINGILWIENNSSLSNIEGLNSVQTIYGGLDIINNSSLSDLNGLEGLTSTSNLYIGANDALNSLNGLDNLSSVSEEAWIEYNDNLTNLSGLGNLSSVGGELRILSNTAMTSLGGLNSLSTVNGTLYIGSNDNLTDISNLSSISTIGNNLWLGYNNSLSNLSGLESLTTIDGGLWLAGNNALTNLEELSSLSSMGGYFLIEYNEGLESLNGLQNLTSIGDMFWIGYNDALSDISSLGSLSSIGGDVSFGTNYSLVDLNGLGQLNSINGDLYVGSNYSLTSLSGLDNVGSVNGEITLSYNEFLDNISAIKSVDHNTISSLNVYNNTNLSACSIESICNYLNLTSPDTDIHDNNTNCNSDSEIQDNCTCSISATVNDIICDDNGTPTNPDDDTFTFDVEVTGSNTSDSWESNDPNNNTGDYNTEVNFGSYLISNGDLDFTINDIDDSDCSTDVYVPAPSTCSDQCTIEAEVINIICSDNGTPTNPDDDTFTFDVKVTGSNAGDSWESNDPNSNTGNYNTFVNFGTYPISGGNLNFTINDISDSGCTTDIFVAAPSTCSNQCDISATVTNITCSDNGTPSNPDDDTFTFDVQVSGSNTGNSWNSSDPNSNTGNYNVVVNFGTYLISGGDLSFTISDNDNSGCTTDVFVAAPNTCSNQCDISATISNLLCDDNGTSTDETDDIFTFDLLVTGTNNGNNWIADDTYNSTGMYDVKKNLGTYLISDGTLVLTITDTENSSCQTVIEVVPPSTCSGTCSIASSLINTICDDNGTPSNPNDDTFTIEVLVTGKNNSNTWFDNLGDSGEYNKNKVLGPYQISDGNFELLFADKNDSDCNSSLDIIAPPTCSSTCEISAVVSDVICDDNNTPSISDDDNFSFSVTVTGNNTGNSWNSNDPNQITGSYNIPKDFGKYLITNGDLNFKITDSKDNTCTTNVNVKAPNTCSGVVCDLKVKQLTIGECDNNNTPNNSNDDLFSITLNVTGTGQNYVVKNGNQNLGSFQYGINEKINGLPANGSTLKLSVFDKTNQYCDTLINVSKQSCSEGCPTVDIKSSFSLCNSVEDFDLNSLIIESSSGKWNFVSGPETITIDDNNKINLNELSSGKYWFAYVLSNVVAGCTEKYLTELDLKEIKQNAIIGKRKLCPGETESIRSQNIFSSYLWNTGETTQSISIVDEGVYSLTVTDGQKCQRISSIEVSYWEDLVANDDKFVFSKNDVLSMNVFSNDEIEDFNIIQNEIIDSTKKGWIEHFGDSLFYYSTYYPESNYWDQFTYKICHRYCKDMCDVATVKISYNGASVSNSEMLLTPNGDGETETLEFKEISLNLTNDFPNNKLVVYNRWGDVVFQKAPYDNNWAGDHNGNTLPEGVYYYIFQLNQEKKEIIYGTILLVK